MSIAAKRLASVVMLSLVSCLTGCAGNYTGGGFIPSKTDPTDKASFGFNLQAIDSTGKGGSPNEWKGQLEYHDHASGLAIHGEVDGGNVSPFNHSGTYTGDYVPQPRSEGPGGKFVVHVFDDDTPGKEADYFSIRLSGGVYNGYSNGGRVEGGHIEYHPPGSN